jgi:hypothetical protein
MSSKDQLIEAARALTARRGTSALTCRQFLAETGFNKHRLRRDWGTWRALCAAAGIEPEAGNVRIPDEALLAAMRDAFVEAGGIAGHTAFARRFAYSTGALRARFGLWPQALARFAAWARANAPDFPHFDALDEALETAGRRAQSRGGAAGRAWQPTAARTCGEPVRFGPLLHAPINENGVILAFGMFAERLGFAVESVAAGYPDCIAKRRVGDGRWQTVRIEFEFRSASFRHHKHDPGLCDLIVCRAHDWPHCPIEVLELKSAIGAMGPSG